MGGAFETAEMVEESTFIAHGVPRIPGLWEDANAKALRRALKYVCEPTPTLLTEVDMMMLSSSMANGTSLRSMQEFDQVLQNVILELLEAGLPPEQVPHLYTRADVRVSD